MPSPFALIPHAIPRAELVGIAADGMAALEAKLGRAVFVISPAGLTAPRAKSSRTRTHDIVPNEARNAALFVLPVKKRMDTSRADIIIGRDARNDIVINDVTLSKVHAFVHEMSDGFALEDAGSKNGTYVSDKQVTGRAVHLKSPASVRFGSVGLRFILVKDLLKELKGT